MRHPSGGLQHNDNLAYQAVLGRVNYNNAVLAHDVLRLGPRIQDDALDNDWKFRDGTVELGFQGWPPFLGHKRCLL